MEALADLWHALTDDFDRSLSGSIEFHLLDHLPRKDLRMLEHALHCVNWGREQSVSFDLLYPSSRCLRVRQLVQNSQCLAIANAVLVCAEPSIATQSWPTKLFSKLRELFIVGSSAHEVEITRL